MLYWGTSTTSSLRCGCAGSSGGHFGLTRSGMNQLLLKREMWRRPRRQRQRRLKKSAPSSSNNPTTLHIFLRTTTPTIDAEGPVVRPLPSRQLEQQRTGQLSATRLTKTRKATRLLPMTHGTTNSRHSDGCPRRS